MNRARAGVEAVGRSSEKPGDRRRIKEKPGQGEQGPGAGGLEPDRASSTFPFAL